MIGSVNEMARSGVVREGGKGAAGGPEAGNQRVPSARRIRGHRLLQGSVMSPFDLKVADGLDDVTAALALVHDSYVALGLIDPHPSGIRLLPHHLLPETRVLLARERAEVVATLTLIPDTAYGLPLDDVYGDRLTATRSQGRRAAELSCLALDPRYRRHDILFHLIRLMHRCAKALAVDDIWVVVAPKHGRFYQNVMLFEPAGGLSYLDKLNGAPGVLYRQNLTTIETRSRQYFTGAGPESDLHTFFFGEVKSSHAVEKSGNCLRRDEKARLLKLCPEVTAQIAHQGKSLLSSFLTGGDPASPKAS